MESDAQVTLVDRAAIVVAASVLCHKNIERLKNFTPSDSFETRNWMKAKNKLNKDIKSLPLPASCKQRVKDFILFVAKGIIEWIQDHYFLNVNGSVLSSLLCWKPKGIIDSIATAKNFISHEKDIVNCFRLACMYCLEDSIFQLWDLIEHQDLPYNDVMECFEVKFWISYIKDDMNGLMDEIEYTGNRDVLYFAFNMSVKYSNGIWAEYFLKKMKEGQICEVAYNKLKSILERPFAFQGNINFKMIPLLSRYINNEMFDTLILKYPATILLHFLQFPIIDKFLRIANKTWNVLINEDFYTIIDTMANFLDEYSGNQIWKNAFELFWKNSPDHSKNYVIEKCIEGSFLLKLGMLEHSNPIIKLIIQSSSCDQRKRMIFSESGIAFFDALIERNRLDCFDMVIQELVGSNNRRNWINELMRTYRHIFKSLGFSSYISTDLKTFINFFENQKNKNVYMNK